jgi:H/ACA ribonucleoprotein complex subunit 3
MKAEVFIKGKRLDYDSNRVLGKGGEGEVFDLGDGLAFKLYKGPDHPDYAGSDAQQVRDREGAKHRLVLMQKKLPSYPNLKTDRVIAPKEIVTDGRGAVVGFTMPILSGAQVLRQLTKAGYRAQTGISNADIIKLFTDLHATVSALHAQKVQIGDFNYLGVMVKQLSAYLIDADSFQFGEFHCRSFTPRFVDPLACPKDSLLLTGDHTEDTDWYAFALMLFECLSFVAPYGGVLTGEKAKQIKPDDRPLQRVSVFHSSVRYPDKALPLAHFSDDVLEFYRNLLLKDKRGKFPLALLQGMLWTNCTACGAVHCRPKCPVCAVASTVLPPVVLEERHGKATVARQLYTPGVILDALFDGGKLLVLYHEDGAFYREGRRQVMSGALQAGLVTLISGNDTIFTTGTTLISLTPGQNALKLPIDTYRGQLPAVAGNGSDSFFISGGRIQRNDKNGAKFLGSTLAGQTLFWAGSKFGLGTYRVGAIRKAFIFDLEKNALNDAVNLDFQDDPIEAECYFSSHRAWLFTVHHERGKNLYRCTVIDANGKVTASAQAAEGDGSWLSNGYGRCAGTLSGSNGQAHCLFVGTDDGLLRLDEEKGSLVEKVRFPDTRGLIRSDDRLRLSSKGIFLVGTHEIRLLTMS